MGENKNTGIDKMGFTCPGLYFIKVKGVLDERHSGYFLDMEIGKEDSEENYSISTLTGNLPDQSALIGVLNSLYNLHLTILSIEILNTD